MKRLMALGVAAIVLAGCGQSPVAGLQGAESGSMKALKKAKASGEAAAIERKLQDAQKRFLAPAQRAPRQGMGTESADYQEMVSAMGEMAALHAQMAELKGQMSDELSQAEAALYAEVAELEREAIADGPQKKGALGRMRDAFWHVVNKLATKPTQAYFNKKPKKTDKPAPKLPRFGDGELAQILKTAQPGDVILWGGQTSFVHGSIYMGNGAIIHALANNTPAGPDAQGVFKENIKDYIARVERNRIVIMRAKGQSEGDRQASMAYMVKQIGKPYDNIFRTHDEAAFYCTELVYHALKRTANPPKIGMRKKVMGLMEVVTTDDYMLSADFETLWTKNAPEPTPAGH